MKPVPAQLPDMLDRLEGLYGRAPEPLPRTALEWVLWENAAYLVSDEHRAAAYQALGEKTALEPAGILGRSREELYSIATAGGMHADRRVTKWVAIAETVQNTFGGDLEAALELPLAKARGALKRFPGIGNPGADKILLFTKTQAVAALDSNGVRVLVRLGYAREGKNYAGTYRDAIHAFASHTERGCEWLIRAHELLRRHGQTLCKRSAPLCDECPLSEECPSSSPGTAQ